MRIGQRSRDAVESPQGKIRGFEILVQSTSPEDGRSWWQRKGNEGMDALPSPLLSTEFYIRLFFLGSCRLPN